MPSKAWVFFFFLLHFTATYMCKGGFSVLTPTKAKRSRLNTATDAHNAPFLETTVEPDSTEGTAPPA